MNIFIPSGPKKPTIFTVGQDSDHDMAHCFNWYALPTSSHHPTVFCLHVLFHNTKVCAWCMAHPPAEGPCCLQQGSHHAALSGRSPLSPLALLPPHSWHLDPATTVTVPGQLSLQMWGQQQSSFPDALQPHAAVLRPNIWTPNWATELTSELLLTV